MPFKAFQHFGRHHQLTLYLKGNPLTPTLHTVRLRLTRHSHFAHCQPQTHHITSFPHHCFHQTQLQLEDKTTTTTTGLEKQAQDWTEGNSSQTQNTTTELEQDCSTQDNNQLPTTTSYEPSGEPHFSRPALGLASSPGQKTTNITTCQQHNTVIEVCLRGRWFPTWILFINVFLAHTMSQVSHWWGAGDW